MWQDSQTVIISSIKATDIVRKNFSIPHFLWDSHHYNCITFGIYTNSGALNPQWVLQAQIHYHNIPNTGEKLLVVARREAFICLSVMAFKLNLTHNIQIIFSAWKQSFFSFFFMKAEVCTNVLRAESVSNTYYHKLALKYWKLAAMQLSDLPSPLYKPSKEAHWCGHFTLPTGLCHFVLGQVLVWRLKRRLCLFVCTLIRAWVRENSSITFLSSERIEVWRLDPNIWSASLRDMGERGVERRIYPDLKLKPFHYNSSTCPCGFQPRALLLVNWEISDKPFCPYPF